jgi:putative transcriptional regulator
METTANKTPMFDLEALKAMTDEEVIARALTDPDNPPLTDEQLRSMKRVSPMRPLRFRLGLSQEAFAERFQIPLGTLRDWEQGRKEPDAAAKAYLRVISRIPEAVMDALQRRP